jgi:DnaJ-class molecular chaperone
MKLIKRKFRQECWTCNGTGINPKNICNRGVACDSCKRFKQPKKCENKCSVCNGTGIYKETSHIIIFGKQAIDSDNIG